MAAELEKPVRIARKRCDACKHNLVGVCPHWKGRAERLKKKAGLVDLSQTAPEWRQSTPAGNGVHQVDIGAGARNNKGFLKLDVVPYFKPAVLGSIVMLPFADGALDEVMCHHVLEHLERKDLIPAMNEMHRVLKDDGIVDIEVPVFPFWQAIADPTHVSFFMPQTFDYFTVNPRGEPGVGKYDFEAKDRAEHRMLYDIKPWKLVERLRVETGEIFRVQLAKVAT